MLSARWRPVMIAAVAVLVIWGLAAVGFRMARNARMTAEKVSAYVDGTDLSRLSGDARTGAINRLAAMLNALTIEERRRARLDRSAWKWFEQMSEEEKGSFVEATLPTGFRQMLASFEEMPERQRQRVVDNALRDLRRMRSEVAGEKERDGSEALVLSLELETRIRTIGLQAFYTQSSAQTKAELAPVLEQIQQAMESGSPFRRRSHFHE